MTVANKANQVSYKRVMDEYALTGLQRQVSSLFRHLRQNNKIINDGQIALLSRQIITMAALEHKMLLKKTSEIIVEYIAHLVKSDKIDVRDRADFEHKIDKLELLSAQAWIGYQLMNERLEEE